MTDRFNAFLSYGFRPFFLLAAIHGALVMVFWLVWIGVHLIGGAVVDMSIAWPPHIWHAHEMLFGFVGAAVAGFLLTAVPSWTKSEPVRGKALALLVVVWGIGRVAVWNSAVLPAGVVAVADGLFLPLLASLVVGGLFGGMTRRNAIFLPILGVFWIANLLVHAQWLGWTDDTAHVGLLLAVNIAVVLIGIIGGRVVPAFTTNALRRRGEDRLPRQIMPLNVLGILSLVAVLVLDAVDAPDAVRGTALFAAAALNFARLAGWRGLATLGEPILWVLHLGFLWLIVGLALRGWAVAGGALNEVTALHAVTTGAFGTMILAVMTRASLGHTGRDLRAGGSLVVAYVLVSVAALIRVAVPALSPAWHGEATVASGVAWSAAMVIFAARFWPILTRPRPRAGNPL